MKQKSIIQMKSFAFAMRIVKLQQHLQESKKEYLLSKQVLRSGTSIGANVHEAFEGSSRKDFINKMSISLKEAVETEYWLHLLYASKIITYTEFNSLNLSCNELVKMLTATIKTSRGNLTESAS